MAVDDSSSDDSLFDEVRTAQFLRISARTLQAWRVRDFGPPFIHLGRAVRYQKQALIDWINGNTHLPKGPRRPLDAKSND